MAALKIRIADIVFDAPARSFLLERVDMKVDAEVDRPTPNCSIGKVSVTIAVRQVHSGRVDEPKRDP